MRLRVVVASAIYSSAFLAGAVSAQEEAAEAVESSTTAVAKPTFTVSHSKLKLPEASYSSFIHLYVH